MKQITITLESDEIKALEKEGEKNAIAKVHFVFILTKQLKTYYLGYFFED